MATSNCCGNSTAKSLAVKVNLDCRKANANVPVASSLLNAYPNPTNDNVIISYFANMTGLYSLSVIDILGRIAAAEQIQSSEGENIHTIDMQQYGIGIYMIQLVKDDETVDVNKVTVQ